jgi:hypothetical protein
MGGIDEALRSRVVSVRVIASQYQAFQLGARVEKMRGDRYNLGKSYLPEETRDALGGFDVVTAIVTLPMHSGQSGGGGDNVLLVVEPYWGSADGRYVTVELGCAHEMVVVRSGRCYYKSKCSKCGWWYEVDSGD